MQTAPVPPARPVHEIEAARMELWHLMQRASFPETRRACARKIRALDAELDRRAGMAS